jgi:hypothetical protein
MRTDGLRLSPLAALAAVLLACCPVPAGQGVPTSFAAQVVTASEGRVIARLEDGTQVALVFRDGPAEGIAVGQRVHVEGSLSGYQVLVEGIKVLGSPG